MSKRIGVWVVIGALMLAPAVGSAGEHGGKAMPESETKLTLSLTPDKDTPSPWTSEVGYGKRACSKLGFGVKNLLLGWTDLFMEPKEALDAGDNFFVGVGYGLKDGIENTLGGAVHTATLFLPQIDAPLPEGGVQLL